MKVWLLIVTMQALFALTFPIGKLALAYTGALFLVGLRMVLAGVMLLSYYCATQPWKPISKSDWWLFGKMALFAVYFSFVPEFWALETMSSLKTNILWSSLPFISALLSYYLLHERLTKNKWFGLTIGLVGMLPVIFMTGPEELLVGQVWHISLPDVMMALAVTSCAYGWFLMKELLQRGHAIIFINGITMLLGGMLCFVTKFLQTMQSVNHEPLYTQFLPVLGYTLILIIISNIIGYTIYGYLLRFCSLTFLSFTGFLCPLFGALLSKLLLNEQLHYQYMIAFFSVLVGLWVFYRDEFLHDKKIATCKPQ